MTQTVRCWLCKGSGSFPLWSWLTGGSHCQSPAEEQCNIVVLMRLRTWNALFRRSCPFWTIIMKYDIVFYESENPESILCLKPFVSSVIAFSRLIILECPRGPPQSLFEVQIAVLFCLGVAELLWHAWLCRTTCTIRFMGQQIHKAILQPDGLSGNTLYVPQGEITTSLGLDFVPYRES